jgi:hypothetical protein
VSERISDEELAELKELLGKCTQGDWSTPHICEPDVNCNCRYILCEGYAGSVATVEVGDGKSISDGGNDCPPIEEAVANGALIAAARNHLPSLIAEIMASRKRDAIVAELLGALKAIDKNWQIGGFSGPESNRAVNRFSDGTIAIWKQIRAAIKLAEEAGIK